MSASKALIASLTFWLNGQHELATDVVAAGERPRDYLIGTLDTIHGIAEALNDEDPTFDVDYFVTRCTDPDLDVGALLAESKEV